QIFPFCERGIMRNIRFGGIAFLRDINLADQAVIECLNSVTELEPSFTHPHQFDAPIALSVNFRLIATISLPTDKDISPSMRSRYTVIHVRDPQLTDVSRGSEAEVFFRDILSRESSIPSSLSEDIDRGLSEALKLSNGILSVKSLVNMASFAKIPPKCCKSPFSLALKQEFPQSDSPNEILSEASLFSEQEFQRVSQNLTVTRRAKEVLSHLLIAHYTESVVNLVGPPGVGKTQITRIFAESVLKKKFIRISCSSDLSQEDLFGSFVPTAHSNSGTKATKMTFQFREGAILEQAAVADSARMAGRKPKSSDEYQGAVILFDEINLAPSNVLSTIIGIMKHPKGIKMVVNSKEYSLKKLQFVCAMNPASSGGGRQELPPALSKLLTEVSVDVIGEKEMQEIIEKFRNEFGPNTEAVASFHWQMVASCKDHACPSGHFDRKFNLRDVEKVVGLLNAHNTVKEALGIVYCECSSSSSSETQELISKLAVCESPEETAKRAFTSRGDFLHSSQRLNPCDASDRLVRLLQQSIGSGKILLLLGPPVSGKSSAVAELARRCSKQLVTVAVHADTDVCDLIGGFSPVSSGSKNSFQFVDGPLVKSMKNGNWILLDNVDHARPEVIERLNSIGESGQRLYVHEVALTDGPKGGIDPKPGFALICTATIGRSSSFQLSESFRNRCIEIFCPKLDPQTDCFPDLFAPLRDGTLCNNEIASIVRRLINDFKTSEKAKREQVTARDLRHILFFIENGMLLDASSLMEDIFDETLRCQVGEMMSKSLKYKEEYYMSGRILSPRFNLKSVQKVEAIHDRKLMDIIVLMKCKSKSAERALVQFVGDEIQSVTSSMGCAISRLQRDPEAHAKVKLSHSEHFHPVITNILLPFESELKCRHLLCNNKAGDFLWKVVGDLTSNEKEALNFSWEFCCSFGGSNIVVNIHLEQGSVSLENAVPTKFLRHFDGPSVVKSLKFNQFLCRTTAISDPELIEYQLKDGSGESANVYFADSNFSMTVKKGKPMWEFKARIGLFAEGNIPVHLSSNGKEQTEVATSPLDLTRAISECYHNTRFKIGSSKTNEFQLVAQRYKLLLRGSKTSQTSVLL
ncbi:hypothetical protein BOX15_Mlig003175g2, partial [Macrostomum lignano]